MVFCIAAISLNASLAKYEAPPLPISAAALRRFKGLAFCLDRDIVWYTDISFILPKLYPNSDICGNAPNLLCIAFYMQGIFYYQLSKHVFHVIQTRSQRHRESATRQKEKSLSFDRDLNLIRHLVSFTSKIKRYIGLINIKNNIHKISHTTSFLFIKIPLFFHDIMLL